MASDDFRNMFYEEAREQLIGLEEGLVELERRQDDRAHLDRTFRAAHSLKGAAAMVGLPAIAEFTHGMEAVLDRIRRGNLAVDSDIITTLLEARDHLAAMVESDANNAPIPAPAELNERLAALLRDVVAPPPAPPADPEPPPPVDPEPPAPPPAPARGVTIDMGPDEPEPEPPPEKAKPKTRASKGAEPSARSKPRGSRAKKPAPAGAASNGGAAKPPPAHISHLEGGGAAYRINFKPGPEVLRRGVNPLGMLDEIRELGPTWVTTDPGLVPTLDELDPERCYLVWEIEVETDAPPDRLEEVFLVVAEDSSVVIERRTGDKGFELLSKIQGLTHKPPPAAKPAVVAPAPVPRAVEAAAPPTAAPVRPSAPSTPVPGSPPPAAPGGRPGVPAAAAAPGAARIRVDANQLDDLVGLAGELAVLSDNLQSIRELEGVNEWVHTLEALERVSRQVRDTSLDLRMVPVDELFSRFPRVVRDLADRFGKEIELRIAGQDTRLDRTIVERFSDPMIHLIRNAVDHALESPDERAMKGKPRKGRISLSAGHEGDRVAIRVEDDGRGLDRDRIVRKGIKLGMVPAGTSADDPRVDTLIFEPGFSTTDKVNELSGRGVGLDVVRDAVRALRGSLAVESHPGKGTAFIFRLPLTLALIDGLIVETDGCVYVVPLAQVEECVGLDDLQPALSAGRPCVVVHNEFVPMVPLRKVFRIPGPPPARQELILTRHAGQRVGVIVDKLLGRVQAVIQALGEGLTGINRFSGATILGNGKVSLILDLAALVTESRGADQHKSSPGVLGAEGF